MSDQGENSDLVALESNLNVFYMGKRTASSLYSAKEFSCKQLDLFLEFERRFVPQQRNFFRFWLM